MTESQITASGTISGVSKAEQGRKTSPAARKRSESPLPADVATIRAAILDVIDAGNQDKQHWFFYENTEGLHNWTEDNANRDRLNFADAVIFRIAQLQQPPFVEQGATTELTVEDCLRELREMFPRSWCYVEVNETGDCSPRGKRDVERSAWIQIDSASGDIIYNHTTDTLSKAMAQVRKWHSEQREISR